jgi:hypothetical protein
LTRPWLEHTIYLIRGEHTNYYTLMWTCIYGHAWLQTRIQINNTHTLTMTLCVIKHDCTRSIINTWHIVCIFFLKDYIMLMSMNQIKPECLLVKSYSKLNRGRIKPCTLMHELYSPQKNLVVTVWCKTTLRTSTWPFLLKLLIECAKCYHFLYHHKIGVLNLFENQWLNRLFTILIFLIF